MFGNVLPSFLERVFLMNSIELGDIVKWGWKRYSKKILSSCDFVGVIVDFPGQNTVNVEKLRKTQNDLGDTIYETYEVMEFCDGLEQIFNRRAIASC